MTCYCAIFNFVYDLGLSRAATLNIRIDIVVEPNAVRIQCSEKLIKMNVFIYLFFITILKYIAF